VSFDAAWLDLREPADHAARDAGLLARAKSYISEFASPLIVDLGSGTGSTVRALDLPDAAWTLVDNDESLLAEASRRCGAAATALRLDLNDVAGIPLDEARLVTASALIDLVSARWVDALVARLAAGGIGFYAALNYDGDMHWSPADESDSAVVQSFNRHQRTDKGFGTALGSQGGAYLTHTLRDAGFEVATAPSPWLLGAERMELHREVLEGIGQAAGEMGCEAAQEWLTRRLEVLSALRGHIGHVDVLALPPR
jgi:hypothetical protein